MRTIWNMTTEQMTLFRNFLTTGNSSTLLKPGDYGLDFGCGPEPLAAMLSEHGFSVALYDPFFYPDNQGYRHGMILSPPPRS